MHKLTLTFMDYDKFEARERVEYGNGTKTDYAYNPLNRRLTGLLAKTATGRAFMDMAYGYDAVGNIRTLANPDISPVWLRDRCDSSISLLDSIA